MRLHFCLQLSSIKSLLLKVEFYTGTLIHKLDGLNDILMDDKV